MKLKHIIKEELIKESRPGVEGYLQSLAMMTSGKQKEYYEYLLDNLKKVDVGSYKDSETLSYHIDNLRREMPETDTFCKKKGCFDTAYNVSMGVKDININYIEGYVQSIIPIQHAWNYYEDENIYFDLINDIAWKNESHFDEYYEIINFNRMELMFAITVTGTGGGFLQDSRFIKTLIE